MHGRRVAVGLCMFCALLVGAVAAQGAAAATNGTTAFTCKEKKEAGGAGFSKAHCTKADSVESGAKFEHVEIAKGTSTEISISNESTGGSTVPFLLKYSMGGVAVPFTATGVTGSGTMENAIDAETGEHYSRGEGTLTFTGVTTSLPGCKVATDTSEGGIGELGVIHTEPLVMTTKGQGDALKVEAKNPLLVATFHLTGCTNSALNGTDSVRGSVKGVPSGSTVQFTHAASTAENSLEGALGTSTKAGVEGSLTVKAKDPKIGGDEFKPISPTTITT
ncbi:MAG TPA: hypothetical protein VFX45_01050 [Solirubrobacterales bacterium]|nr:hypothetical protein [Solirubrobacterales bacterium]